MDETSSVEVDERIDVEIGRRFATPRPRRLRCEIDQDGARFSWAAEDVPSAVALTRAERDVLARIATGASNAEIASARGVSVRTVANQVARLFKKLNATSRYELIQWTALAHSEAAVVERESMSVVARSPAADWRSLTADERDVVWRFAQALPYKNIAYELDLAIGTVVGRLRRAMRKLRVSSRVELLERLGLRSPRS